MRLLLISCLLAGALAAHGQASLEEITATPGKAGGVYYAYPVTESANTPAPKGYKPFYISHYGRHGSRYLISDDDVSNVRSLFASADTAGALTPLGRDVLTRLDSLWLEARGRGGELTPLGNRQHHDIATRMYKAFPEAFPDDARLTARSTTVMRCAHSMFAFVEGLKEQNPRLVIPRESSQRNMDYLNYHTKESGKYSDHRGEWYQDWRKFRQEKTNPDRLVSSLFSDSLYVRRHIDPVELMWQLYWVAVDMQNVETQLDFFDLFTPQELYDLWQVFNFNFFACNSSYLPARGLHVDNAKNLLTNILETADEYVNTGTHGATLRFGHDGNIIPLAALLRIPGAYTNEDNPYLLAQSYADFKISPMASNMQIVFFRDKKDDVIVKVMLNEREQKLPLETDIFPFYHWNDFRNYLIQAIETPFIEFQTANL